LLWPCVVECDNVGDDGDDCILACLGPAVENIAGRSNNNAFSSHSFVRTFDLRVGRPTLYLDLR